MRGALDTGSEIARADVCLKGDHVRGKAMAPGEKDRRSALSP